MNIYRYYDIIVSDQSQSLTNEALEINDKNIDSFCRTIEKLKEHDKSFESLYDRLGLEAAKKKNNTESKKLGFWKKLKLFMKKAFPKVFEEGTKNWIRNAGKKNDPILYKGMLVNEMPKNTYQKPDFIKYVFQRYMVVEKFSDSSIAITEAIVNAVEEIYDFFEIDEKNDSNDEDKTTYRRQRETSRNVDKYFSTFEITSLVRWIESVSNAFKNQNFSGKSFTDIIKRGNENMRNFSKIRKVLPSCYILFMALQDLVRDFDRPTWPIDHYNLLVRMKSPERRNRISYLGRVRKDFTTLYSKFFMERYDRYRSNRKTSGVLEFFSTSLVYSIETISSSMKDMYEGVLYDWYKRYRDVNPYENEL